VPVASTDDGLLVPASVGDEGGGAAPATWMVLTALDAVDAAAICAAPRALLVGVDGSGQRDDAALGLHVDLEEVRRRLRVSWS